MEDYEGSSPAGGIGIGDLIMLRLVEERVEVGVLLAMSDVGVHLKTLYEGEWEVDRLSEGGRAVVAESVKGLGPVGIRRYAWGVGMRGMLLLPDAILKRVCVRRTVDGIEEDAMKQTLKPLTRPVTRIIPHDLVERIELFEEWHEEQFLRSVGLEDVTGE